MRWYVYHLVDPRDGVPFYVGKGTGSRIRDHEVEAKRGVTSLKCIRIKVFNALDPVKYASELLSKMVRERGKEWVASKFVRHGIVLE